LPSCHRAGVQRGCDGDGAGVALDAQLGGKVTGADGETGRWVCLAAWRVGLASSAPCGAVGMGRDFPRVARG